MQGKLVILQKTYDMVQYGYVCLRQFPRSEKHTFAAEIKRCMIDLLRYMFIANKQYHKKKALQQVDVQLDLLRLYVRLAKDRCFLPTRKYEHWSKQLNEIGRMLGGWIKAVRR